LVRVLVTRKERDFAKRSKILLDTNLKIILLNHQNNFVKTLKIISDVAKNFDILTTNLSSTQLFYIVQQNYFFDLWSN